MSTETVPLQIQVYLGTSGKLMRKLIFLTVYYVETLVCQCIKLLAVLESFQEIYAGPGEIVMLLKYYTKALFTVRQLSYVLFNGSVP